MGDDGGWYILDIGSVVKFNLNGEDFPPFIAVIPAIIALLSVLFSGKSRGILIEISGIIILIVFWVQDSNAGENQYGANPKA